MKYWLARNRTPLIFLVGLIIGHVTYYLSNLMIVYILFCVGYYGLISKFLKKLRGRKNKW